MVESGDLQKNNIQAKTKKPPRSNDRGTYKSRQKYKEQTPLNTTRERILNKIMNVELKDEGPDDH